MKLSNCGELGSLVTSPNVVVALTRTRTRTS